MSIIQPRPAMSGPPMIQSTNRPKPIGGRVKGGRTHYQGGRALVDKVREVVMAEMVEPLFDWKLMMIYKYMV